MDSREVAEGGGESEEISDTEDERSDKESNLLEEGEEEEEEEEEDAGKQNSNDLKNLPCDPKCGSSKGFQGCNDKCSAEDLTPYQVFNLN